MVELLEMFKVWFFSLGEQYGVNPIIFGSIYVGAIPFFTLCTAWTVRNYRLGRSVVLPSLLATFFFTSAYLYLIIEGENVPWWVYGIVVLMVGYGAWSTYKKVRRKLNKIDHDVITDE